MPTPSLTASKQQALWHYPSLPCFTSQKANEAATTAVESSSSSTSPPVFNISLGHAPQPPVPALQAIPALPLPQSPTLIPLNQALGAFQFLCSIWTQQHPWKADQQWLQSHLHLAFSYTLKTWRKLNLLGEVAEMKDVVEWWCVPILSFSEIFLIGLRSQE